MIDGDYFPIQPGEKTCRACMYFLPGRPIGVCKADATPLGWTISQGGCRRSAGSPPTVNSHHWCGEFTPAAAYSIGASISEIRELGT
jgi:hypothetical protein